MHTKRKAYVAVDCSSFIPCAFLILLMVSDSEEDHNDNNNTIKARVVHVDASACATLQRQHSRILQTSGITVSVQMCTQITNETYYLPLK